MSSEIRETIYAQIGGFATVRGVVEDFYDRLIKEDTLRHYFVGIDMSRLIRHQTDFVCMVMGGPVDYTGRQLRDSHRHLAITSVDFELVVTILENCLLDGGLEEKHVEEIMGAVRGAKGDIVSEPKH
jgi:hemoglobin